MALDKTTTKAMNSAPSTQLRLSRWNSVQYRHHGSKKQSKEASIEPTCPTPPTAPAPVTAPKKKDAEPALLAAPGKVRIHGCRYMTAESGATKGSLEFLQEELVQLPSFLAPREAEVPVPGTQAPPTGLRNRLWSRLALLMCCWRVEDCRIMC